MIACASMRRVVLWVGLLATSVSSVLTGCDVRRFAANQTVKVLEAGSEGAAAFWDYKTAGEAIPATIMQGEALLRVTPMNEQLLLGMARTYVSYAYGWLQLDWEQAEAAGDFEKADGLAVRIRLFNARAKHLAMKTLRQHDDEGQLDQVLATRDQERTAEYVRLAFDDEDDVPPLYWAAVAWGSVIASSEGSLDELADAPLALALLKRSIELDPTYQDGAGYSLLGSVEAASQLIGGDLEQAQEYFEKALAFSERRNHLVQVSYAKSYAVAAQDRELFVELLREVLHAPDQGDGYRLVNKVARRRAEYYIQHVDDWFLPPSSE